MAPTDTTVSINGEKTVLAFGRYFRVRYGKDDRVLRAAQLVERKANGDLVFVADDSPIRVRPSTIDTILPEDDALDSGPLVPDRLDGETSAEYLARIESALGASAYTRWIGTETGQATLAKVAEEERTSRAKARKAPKSEPAFGLPSKEKPLYTDDEKAALARQAKSIRDAERAAKKEKPLSRLEVDVAAATDPALPAAILAGEVAKKRSGPRPYSERNQVWKCGTCKRRTRQPFCANGHDRVDAPAGKRREDRVGKEA